MADIELVIKIPEKIYESVMDGTYCGTLYQELKNGTPLPKGHGRLIDVDEVIKIANKKKDLCGAIWNAPTIIEADEVEE